MVADKMGIALPRRSELIVAMLSGKGEPQRLTIRHNALFGGTVIEGPDALPIGGTFPTLEAAHKAHSNAWIAAWTRYDERAESGK